MRVKTNPLALGQAIKGDEEVRIDEDVRLPWERGADAVPEIGGGNKAHERRGQLAGDERRA
jgi:hypothetical protein